MREAKNTQRALVKIGFDGRVHKFFRGPKAKERYDNEVRVLQYLEERGCPFVPRLLDSDDAELKIVTSNCGAIVEHISDDRAKEVFDELLKYGVRHEDPFPRNITYRVQDGRFCAIDFEFATILDDDWTKHEKHIADSVQNLELVWSGTTDRGHMRPNNEDAFLLLRLGRSGIQYLGKEGEASLRNAEFIFAVSDGMGGENSGEFASRIALDKITLRLPREFDVSEDWAGHHSQEVLAELFRSIHSAMLDLGRHDMNCRDMGATLTLVWFKKSRLYFAHIGDSRLYKVGDSGLEQVTEDHSHVGWLRRSGKINEREARMHPRKNALDQALGAGHRYLNPHIGVLEIQPGDKLLICSDGVTDGLWDHRLEQILRERPVPGIAPELVCLAVEESGRDNATAVVVGVEAAAEIT